MSDDASHEHDRVKRLKPQAEAARASAAALAPRNHDVGGAEDLMTAPLPKDRPNTVWELECHALFANLAKARHISTDELRRAIENLPAAAYASWGYYEKWSAAMAQLLRERGHLGPGELEAEMRADDAPPAALGAPRFAKGGSVTVRADERMRTQWRAPHLRTPGYIFGARGVVERLAGTFSDPSPMAYGEPNPPKQHLYRVRFAQSELWPEVEPRGGADDTVDVEIYENWLLSEGEAPSEASADALRSVRYGHEATKASFGHCPQPAVEHPHAHAHSHDGGEVHVHLSRPEVEVAAVAKEPPPAPGAEVHHALLRLALRKQLVSREAIRTTMESIETAGARLDGAKLIARAWVDPEYKARLLADGNAAAAEIGINATNPNAPTQLTVVANDEATHNLIVCTLCSCYPVVLLGPSPTWYKSRSYRARAVRAPRKLLADEFGLALPPGVALRVHDSTADMRYIVMPNKPAGTEGLDEEALRQMITRDGLVGVATV